MVCSSLIILNVKFGNWKKLVTVILNSLTHLPPLGCSYLSPTTSASVCGASVGCVCVCVWLISARCCFSVSQRNRALTSKYYFLTPVYSQYKFSSSVCELSDWSAKNAQKTFSLSPCHPLSPLVSLSVGNIHTFCLTEFSCFFKSLVENHEISVPHRWRTEQCMR